MRQNRRLGQLWLDALATELGASAGTLDTYTDDLTCYLAWLDEQAAETLADGVHLKERGHSRRSVSFRRRASQGQTPSGSATITNRRQMP